ncbi:RGG repeats nuclear RNA binding protein A-like [Apium graveolens]|uniref:RGG repeats nuclear RNA binding protein A-like n=1 Tax=Apium graveolens TaxID=4045 RepID=UPI003D7BFC88
MATANPFDLLGDDDNDDVSHLVAIQLQKKAPSAAPAPPVAKQPAKQAKLPSKPVPPAQAVKEAKSEGVRGGGRGGGRGYGRRGGGGYNRDFAGNDSSFSNSGLGGSRGAIDGSDSSRTVERRGIYGGPRSGFRGGRHGGEEGNETPNRRVFERRSGTGHGYEYKREGSGQGNWGSPTDEISQVTEEFSVEGGKSVDAKKPSGEEGAEDGTKYKAENETEEKEPENKEMTLEEYEKVLEEKRKALESLKTEARKVEMDKELASMQQLSNKKSNDEIFAKLGSDKDKRKDNAEKEERVKKSFSINEFLKPAEGETYYSSGGRGRGRGFRGGSFSGSSGMSSYEKAPAIEDPSQFPTLGGK